MTSTPDRPDQPDQSSQSRPRPATRRPARQPARRPWRPSTRPPGPTNPDPATPLEEVRLAVGRIVGAHGIRGEVKLDIMTDDPDQLLDLRRVYFDDDPSPQRLAGVRFHGRQALLTFPDITDRDAAEALRGTIVRIAGTQAKLPAEGEFYHYQLIGLSVYDESGQLLGKLAEILPAGEVDVYVVRDRRGREHLFPALKDVVLEIDPASDLVVVRPQEWEADDDNPGRHSR